MTELLIQKIREYVDLQKEDIQLLNNFVRLKQVEKGDFLFKPGDTIGCATFVNSGLFRDYMVNEKGLEYTLQFAVAGWWTGDFGSFIYGKETNFYIEALEDSEVLTISKSSWEDLLIEAPFYLQYHRKLIERILTFTQNRLLEAYSTNAETKYLNLIATFPDILNRVPQYMIASYLGMSRETLSRVRRLFSRAK